MKSIPTSNRSIKKRLTKQIRFFLHPSVILFVRKSGNYWFAQVWKNNRSDGISYWVLEHKLLLEVILDALLKEDKYASWVVN